MPGKNTGTHDDKFYTPLDTANQLIKLVNAHKSLTDFKRIIEPSAGNGAILKPLQSMLDSISWDGELLAYDLIPEDTSIKQMNWLERKNANGDDDLSFPYYTRMDKKALWDDGARTLVIGNPPFGRNGSLALKFINEATAFNPSMIAFILPKSFMKASMQSKINNMYAITECIEVKNDKYILPNGGTRKVPTCILIIEHQTVSRTTTSNANNASSNVNTTTNATATTGGASNVSTDGISTNRMSIKQLSGLMPFTFCTGSEIDNADWMIVRAGGSAGVLKPMSDMTPANRKYNYFIKMRPGDNTDMPVLMKRAFDSLDSVRSMTSGPRSISKIELMQAVLTAMNSLADE